MIVLCRTTAKPWVYLFLNERRAQLCVCGYVCGWWWYCMCFCMYARAAACVQFILALVLLYNLDARF